MKELLRFRLIRTIKRIVFDIEWQHDDVTFKGEDDGDYITFVASNGYSVISRSRMDIQTERIWLKGGISDAIAFRSGSMVFDSNEKRDKAYGNFLKALDEWAKHNGGYVTKLIGED